MANPCITMIMGNAYRPNDTLLYDHLSRRSRKSNGLATYPEKVIEAHENFSFRIMESSAAKAEIVYGRPAQKRVFSRIKSTCIPLWGDYETVLSFCCTRIGAKSQTTGTCFEKSFFGPSSTANAVFEGEERKYTSPGSYYGSRSVYRRSNN
jgi:hypothetical protein